MKKNDTTIQEKIAELDTLVAWFDSDEFNLEGAIAQFTKAETLAKEIEHDLLKLKNEIEVVKQKFDQA